MQDYHVKTVRTPKPGFVVIDLQISSNGFPNRDLEGYARQSIRGLMALTR